MNVLSQENQKKVEDLLISEGLLDSNRLATLKAEAQKTSQPFFSYLLQNKLVTNEQLTETMAKTAGLPYVNLLTSRIEQSMLNFLPVEVAERFMSVPIAEAENRLGVAMLDPNNVQAVDFISNKIGRPIKVYMASEEGIRHVLEQYNTDLQEGVSEAITSVDSQLKDEAQAEALSDQKGAKRSRNSDDVKTIVQDSPISRALSTILEYAIRSRASDIHIEPLETSLRIRCRVDGILREIMKLPKTIEPALISRVKILSNLKIDEHRVPQDGQFTVRISQRDADLRIAISPVVWGEQVIIRILDKTNTSFKLEDLGYIGRSLRAIRKGLKRPNGMVLASGPTGSGKTTSLYALIQEIKSDSINIVTLEDPVEYKMEGVNQIQVNPDVGLTFANGLRSILRQDPDVVLVGEIRDKETADLAVQAALTGHLVFSTLHTNSAAGVLPRLLDMGIEPFLIASTVNTIIAQRLVRRIGEGGVPIQADKVGVESIHATLSRLLPANEADVPKVSADLGYEHLPLATQNAYTLKQGKDTPQTPGGYHGQVGLYEVIDVNEEIQEMILARASQNEIKSKAMEQGMVTMREDGYLKAISDITTLDEVNRVTAADNS